MNRRSFLSQMLLAGVAPFILPAAVEYKRVWSKSQSGLFTMQFIVHKGINTELVTVFSKTDAARFLQNKGWEDYHRFKHQLSILRKKNGIHELISKHEHDPNQTL